MASSAMRLLIFVGLAVAANTLTMAPDATSDVIAAAQSAQDGGEVAIVVRPHTKGSRRAELLHVKGADDDAVSLFYNKKSHKVSLESLYSGHLKSVSWALGSESRSALTLVVSSNRVKLYVGCKALHHHELPGRYDLLTMLTNPKLRLYHEESAPVEIFGNEGAALDSLNCETHQEIKATLVSVDDTDMVDVKQIDEREKREDEMQGDDYRANFIDSNGVLPTPLPPRGDIPSIDIDCDEKVFRQLQILSQTVEKLRREIADQKGTIDHLNGQLRECCKKEPTPSVERCTDSTCYRGY